MTQFLRKSAQRRKDVLWLPVPGVQSIVDWLQEKTIMADVHGQAKLLTLWLARRQGEQRKPEQKSK